MFSGKKDDRNKEDRTPAQKQRLYRDHNYSICSMFFFFFGEPKLRQLFILIIKNSKSLLCQDNKSTFVVNDILI